MSSSDLEKPVVNAEATLSELRARVLAQAGQQPAPTRAQNAARQRIVLALVLVVSLLVFFAWGGLRASPRPGKLVLETSLGSAILAVGVALAALGRGRSMLGRSRVWLTVVVIATPLALFGWRVLASAQYPGMMVEWSERPGFRCFAFSSTLALIPLLSLLWLRRGSDPVHPYMTAAAFAAAAGAGAWVFVDLWCPVGYVPHLLLGHVAPIVLLTALSALFGSRLLRLRKLR
jgi:hypothetical protein